jgi:putative toxin-antitoxin system antitoxin component (TIGR02293 family)
MVVTNTKVVPFVPPAHSGSEEIRTAKVLGLSSLEIRSLMRVAAKGLSWQAVKRFLDAIGLTQQAFAEYLDIPERTFARRRETGAFDRKESEQVVRLAEIYEAAQDLFDGDKQATYSWLTKPTRGLGGARPIDFAKSEFGAREVRDLIGRLADGVFS